MLLHVAAIYLFTELSTLYSLISFLQQPCRVAFINLILQTSLTNLLKVVEWKW